MKQDIPEQWNLVDYCSNCKKAVIGILIGAGDEYSHTECPECDKITESIDIYKYIEPLQSQLKEANEGIQSAKDLLLIASDKVSELKSELKELREENETFKDAYIERNAKVNELLESTPETEQQPEGKVVEVPMRIGKIDLYGIFSQHAKETKMEFTAMIKNHIVEIFDRVYKFQSNKNKPQVEEGNKEQYALDQYHYWKNKIKDFGFNDFVHSKEVDQYREWLRNDKYKHRIEWFEKKFPNGLFYRDADGFEYGVNIITKSFLSEADAAWEGNRKTMKQDIPEEVTIREICQMFHDAIEKDWSKGQLYRFAHNLHARIEPLQSQLKELKERFTISEAHWGPSNRGYEYKISELESELKELREERDAFKRLYEGNGTWKVDAERLYDENDELKQEIERLKAGETEQQPEGKVVDEVYKLIDREIMDIRVKINKTLFGNSKQLEVDDLLYKLLSSCPENVVKLIQPQVGEGNTLHTCTNRDKLYSFLYSVTGKHTKEVQWMTDEILNILEPKAEEGNKEKEEK
jgi:hypothetical protein